MTREAIVEELLKLRLANLEAVLEELVERLASRGDLKLAGEIIDQYLPALDEFSRK